MANDLLNELNRNLKSAEEVGDQEWAGRLKKRITQLEKVPAAPAATPVPEKAEPVKTVAAKKAAPKKRK